MKKHKIKKHGLVKCLKDSSGVRTYQDYINNYNPKEYINIINSKDLRIDYVGKKCIICGKMFEAKIFFNRNIIKKMCNNCTSEK